MKIPWSQPYGDVLAAVMQLGGLYMGGRGVAESELPVVYTEMDGGRVNCRWWW